MATFTYIAKDKKGARVEGSMEAEAQQAVVTRLQQMGFFPIKIDASRGGAAAGPVARSSGNTTTMVRKPDLRASQTSAPTAAAASTPRQPFFKSPRITAADIASFNRQLSDLIGAGIPLVKALNLLTKQVTNEAQQQIILQTLDDVQGGATFADALSRHPRVFSKLYVAMVRSGEAGGMLGDVLQRLADFSEAEEQLKGKIKSSLAYPAVMILAGSVAVAVMFGFVIPKITATFDQLGQTLPAMTLVLIAISRVFQSYWWALLGGLALGVGGFMQYVRSTDGRLWWDRLQLRLPLMGTIVQKREVARFCRTLGSLLKNGVSMLTALDIVREVVDNSVVRREVEHVIDRITQGEPLAEPLRQSTVFPSLAVNMIAIGEETGRLPEVLLRVSESYETQVERTVRTLTSLIEPLIIVAMGCIVGFIVIAMLLPIFSMDPSAAVRR